MQYFVGLAVQRFAQELLVEALDDRILVALAQFLADVLAVYGALARFDDLNVTMVVGLTCATNATTRTCHHLNDMIFYFTCTQFVHDDAGIG